MKFDEKGLITAIAQDAVTNEVLMVAYMNEATYKETLETGYMTYFSRSKNARWKKGETSGHVQKVVSVSEDCDGDALLFKVNQTGVACHTGARSCFFNTLKDTGGADGRIVFDVLRKIKERKEKPVEGSYTNYLFTKGLDKILKKVGEEATEAVIAAKNKDKKELTNELSDLLFHTLVLMVNENIEPDDIFSVLMEREGKPAEPKYKNKA